MKKYGINSSRGFTLVEVLFSMIFIAAIMGGIVSLFSTSVTAWQRGTSRTEIQHAARFAVDSIVRDIKYADQITNVNNPVGSITLRVVRNGVAVPVRYSVNNQRVMCSRNNGVDQPLTGETSNGTNNIIVTELQFLVLPPGATPIRTVNVFITVQDQSRTPITSYTLETAVTSMLLSQE